MLEALDVIEKQTFSIRLEDSISLRIIKEPGAFVDLVVDATTLELQVKNGTTEALLDCLDGSAVSKVIRDFTVKKLDETQLQCGICFQIWAADVLPCTFSCTSCSTALHRSCLLMWLESDPRSHKVYGKLSGHCPACDEVHIYTLCRETLLKCHFLARAALN